ncbi:hypothetical protein YQE_01105, partial [Dendroctonus ponderosae]
MEVLEVLGAVAPLVLVVEAEEAAVAAAWGAPLGVEVRMTLDGHLILPRQRANDLRKA